MESCEERRPEIEGVLSVDDLAKGIVVMEGFRRNEYPLEDGFAAGIAASITWE